MGLLVLSLSALMVVAPASPPDLSGRWEVQSMGADREVSIQQKGSKVVAHRVMWPEFEGEKYKLEHLYRGTVTNNGEIRGELLVKEPELKDYEVLRDFTGRITATGELTLDGLPLKRVDAANAAPPAPLPETKPAKPNEPSRPSEPPAMSQAIPVPPASDDDDQFLAVKDRV